MLDRVFKSGAAARFDSRYFEGFGLPKVLESVFAHIGKINMHTIEILPVPSDERVIWKVSVLDGAGKEMAGIPYIECRLTQRGTEEITYTRVYRDL